MNSTDNRRREIRKKVMAFTPVYDEDRGVILGYLGNLTLHGAMIIGEKPLEVDAHATLHIEFVDELPGDIARRLVIPARVARCVADEESYRDFNIGFEFREELTPEQSKVIQVLLDRYHFRHRSWAKEEE